MNKNKDILEKLDQIVSKQPSKWHEEAKFRAENRDWLRHSQAISLKVLRRLRELDLSQKELAEKMKVSPQQINKWVKGKENFTLETISKLENVLDFTILNIEGIPDFGQQIKYFYSSSFKPEIGDELDIAVEPKRTLKQRTFIVKKPESYKMVYTPSLDNG